MPFKSDHRRVTYWCISKKVASHGKNYGNIQGLLKKSMKNLGFNKCISLIREDTFRAAEHKVHWLEAYFLTCSVSTAVGIYHSW